MSAEHRNAIVVNYPNQVGDTGRYALSDQRDYFSKFYCGSSFIFELALSHALDGDLLSFQTACGEIFDQHYHVRFDENTANLIEYTADRREFYRRTFDLYRYAKTSLNALGKNHGFTTVRRLSTNHRFDTGSFLLT